MTGRGSNALSDLERAWGYRERAAELYVIARRIQDADVHAELMELANRWIELAERLESARQVNPDPGNPSAPEPKRTGPADG